MSNLKEDLTCTLCKVQQETYSEIVYSQGDRVCFDCKKGTQKADNSQFDIDMKHKIIDGFHAV